MPLKDYLLRIMSVRTNTPEKTIEAVVQHQFEEITKAMQSSSINSIEVSGFGKFIFNPKKAIKKWDNYTKDRKRLEEAAKMAEEGSKKETLEAKAQTYIKWESNIKPRIDATKSAMGRLEEQTPSQGGTESSD